jgi:hypothetical protein
LVDGAVVIVLAGLHHDPTLNTVGLPPGQECANMLSMGPASACANRVWCVFGRGGGTTHVQELLVLCSMHNESLASWVLATY